MIYSLNGKLTHTDLTSAIIDCGGVGFLCNTSLNTLKKLPQVGNNVFVYTHLVVKEDAMDIYAFFDTEELRMFKLLISVSGVGPKMGQRVCLELKDKVGLSFESADTVAATAASSSQNAKDAVEALTSLGYSQSEASLAIGKLNPDAPVEQLIKEGLSALAKKL